MFVGERVPSTVAHPHGEPALWRCVDRTPTNRYLQHTPDDINTPDATNDDPVWKSVGPLAESVKVRSRISDIVYIWFFNVNIV